MNTKRNRGWNGKSRAARRAWPAGGLALVAGVAALLGPEVGIAAAQPSGTSIFTSPGQYEFTVPQDVTSVTVTAVGAAGGACGTGAGGEGASVTGTFAVQPGQVLDVVVPGMGGDCATGGGTAGLGGGGAGGTPTNPLLDGAGGGGAARVELPSAATPLIVAAGGGGAGDGAGTGAGGQGGNAGANGQNAAAGTGGGAGSATAGGAGGVGGGASAANGLPGSLGLGGAGGAFASPAPGGGGGGGGYFGGGGGGGSLGHAASGGGGGSSFLAPDATNTTGPTPTSAPAGVTIAYPVASVSLSTQSLTFPGSQTQGTVSAPQTLTVTDAGSVPLLVSGVQTSGPNAPDYLISNGCTQALAPGSSCQIGVRFAPQSQGPSSAMLSVLSNSITAVAPVTLSGTGAAPVQSAPPPVTTQVSHSSGTSQGARGPSGHVICHKAVRGSAQCEIEFAPGTAIQGKSVRATFKVGRGNRVAAHGTLTLRRGVLARQALRLAPGSYTLIISTGSGRHTKTLLRLPFRVH